MKRIMLLLALLPGPREPAQVNVRLSEWKVELSQQNIAEGPVTFVVTNSGQIPHAIEVEGQGIEKEIETIQPGATGTLTLTLKRGRYEVYCPVGEGSHKKLGMEARLTVGSVRTSESTGYDGSAMGDAPAVQAISVTGGGPVVQILPGPFPFPDSAAPILQAFGHLYRKGTLVTDNAMVHVMLLSRTRRDGDFALACWDCSRNKIEELQLQILPGPGEPKFDAPGGFLFVNWEQSSSRKPTS